MSQSWASRDERTLVTWAIGLGFTFTRSKAGHGVLVHPSGVRVAAPKKSGGGRDLKNAKAQIRRVLGRCGSR